MEVDLKRLRVSSNTVFTKMVRYGWSDFAGRIKVWYDHQKPGHDKNFEEPREPRPQKKKFQKEKR